MSVAKFGLLACLVILAVSSVVLAERTTKSSHHLPHRSAHHNKSSPDVFQNTKPSVPPLHSPPNGERITEESTTVPFDPTVLEEGKHKNKHPTLSFNIKTEAPPVKEGKRDANYKRELTTISAVINDENLDAKEVTQRNSDPITASSSIPPKEIIKNRHHKKGSLSTEPAHNVEVPLEKKRTTATPREVSEIPIEKAVKLPPAEEEISKDLKLAPQESDSTEVDHEEKKTLTTPLPKGKQNITLVSKQSEAVSQDSLILDSNQTQTKTTIQQQDMEDTLQAPPTLVELKSSPAVVKEANTIENNNSSAAESRVNVIKIKMSGSSGENGESEPPGEQVGNNGRANNPAGSSRKRQRMPKQRGQLRQQQEAVENEMGKESEVSGLQGNRKRNRPRSGSRRPSENNQVDKKMNGHETNDEQIDSLRGNNRKGMRASSGLRRRINRNQTTTLPPEQPPVDETLELNQNKRPATSARRNANGNRSRASAESRKPQGNIQDAIRVNEEATDFELQNTRRNRLTARERSRSGNVRNTARVISEDPPAGESEGPKEAVNTPPIQEQSKKRRRRPLLRRTTPRTPQPSEINQPETLGDEDSTRGPRRRNQGRLAKRRQQLQQGSNFDGAETRKKRDLRDGDPAFFKTTRGQPENSVWQRTRKEWCAYCTKNKSCSKMKLQMCSALDKKNTEKNYIGVVRMNSFIKIYKFLMFLVVVGMLIFLCTYDGCHQEHTFLITGLIVMCLFYIPVILVLFHGERFFVV